MYQTAEVIAKEEDRHERTLNGLIMAHKKMAVLLNISLCLHLGNE